MKEKRLVVIGGGPAGFFCGVNAARMSPTLEVIIIEKSEKVLSKLKASGGGRCNITHGSLNITEMAERYPRGKNFVKKAFHRFFVPDLVRWFRERGIRIKQEPDGRMFPSTDSSQTVIDCLMQEASHYGVQVMTKVEASGLLWSGGLWEVKNQTRRMEADYVCIACGGYPHSEMFSWLTDLGHTIETPVPSLFTFNIPGTASLKGIVVQDALVKVIGSKMQERGPLLFTHWGMSGPAVINLSAWAARELAAPGRALALRLDVAADGRPVFGWEALAGLGGSLGVAWRADRASGAMGGGLIWRSARLRLRTSHLAHPDLGLTHRIEIGVGRPGASPW